MDKKTLVVFFIITDFIPLKLYFFFVTIGIFFFKVFIRYSFFGFEMKTK
jgi:hypothetical protein